MKDYYIIFLVILILSFTSCQNEVTDPTKEINNLPDTTITDTSGTDTTIIDTTNNDTTENNVHMVHGIVQCNDLPISGAELTFTTGFDTFTTVTDINGLFELELEPNKHHRVSVYSFKHLEHYFRVESSIDTNITVKLDPIDYYPSMPGMSWKYSYEEKDDDSNMWAYYLTIERTILSSSDSTITNQIQIEGWGYDLRTNPTRDTINITKDFEFIETINARGFYNSFLSAVPFEIGNKFKTMSKYLHPDPKSNETNPSTLIPCEFLELYDSYLNVLKSKNGIINFDQVPFWDISTTYIANDIGYISIFHLYRHDFADRYYQLQLLEFSQN